MMHVDPCMSCPADGPLTALLVIWAVALSLLLGITLGRRLR